MMNRNVAGKPTRHAVMLQMRRVLGLMLLAGSAAFAHKDRDARPKLIDLKPKPTMADLGAARQAFLAGNVIRIIGGTPKDLQRLLDIRGADTKVLLKSKGEEKQVGRTSGIQFVAVHAARNGALHEFHGFTSGSDRDDNSQAKKSFTKWLERERRCPDDERGVGDPTPPSSAAWTELRQLTDQYTGDGAGQSTATETVYRLNDIDSASDWYMVTQDPETTPDFEICGVALFYPCYWTTGQRTFSIATGEGFPLSDHGPLNKITSTTAGFSIGGGLDSTGPGVSATFGESWQQLSVTTTDQTVVGGNTASWEEEFTARGLSAPPVTSSATFLSHQAAIFQVPEGTEGFSVAVASYITFDNQDNYNHIVLTSDTDLIATIPVAAPVFSVSPAAITIPPGGQATIHVTAANPYGAQGLPWKLNTNQSWLSVPSPGSDYSSSQDIVVSVAPGTAPNSPGGVVTIDTDPAFAAPSVESQPLTVQVTVGSKPIASTSGILLAGGWSFRKPLASAEIYDPVSGNVFAASPMGTARVNHTATALPNGDVLITGGQSSGAFEDATATAELFHPATASFSYVNGASTCPAGGAKVGCMNLPRTGHTATLLPNGKVLIAGGYNAVGFLEAVSEAELYDPATQTFTPTGSLNLARGFHSAVLLETGDVLICSGTAPNNIGPDQIVQQSELYQPNGTFALAAEMTTPQANVRTSKTEYNTVFALGGLDQNFNPSAVAELYSVGSDFWETLPNMITPRNGFAAASLPGGGMLALGGTTVNGGKLQVIATVETWNGLSETWPFVSNMSSPRSFHTANLLSSGKVFIAGGRDNNNVTLGTTELFDPVAGSTPGSAITPRESHTATPFQVPSQVGGGGGGKCPKDAHQR